MHLLKGCISAPRTMGRGIPGLIPGRFAVPRGLEQVAFLQLKLYICIYVLPTSLISKAHVYRNFSYILIKNDDPN